MLNIGKPCGVSGNLEAQLGDEWPQVVTGTIKCIRVREVGRLGIGIDGALQLGKSRGNKMLFGQQSLQFCGTYLVSLNFLEQICVVGFRGIPSRAASNMAKRNVGIVGPYNSVIIGELLSSRLAGFIKKYLRDKDMANWNIVQVVTTSNNVAILRSHGIDSICVSYCRSVKISL
jgi:hypothetical protein